MFSQIVAVNKETLISLPILRVKSIVPDLSVTTVGSESQPDEQKSNYGNTAVTVSGYQWTVLETPSCRTL